MNKIRIHVTYVINLSYNNSAPVDLLFCHLNNYTRNLFTVQVEVYAENRIDEPFLILILYYIHLQVIGLRDYTFIAICGIAKILNARQT